MDGREETSIWKKEITFGRKPKATDETAPATPEKTSIWKKEITFRRKQPQGEYAVFPAAAPPVSPPVAPPNQPAPPPVAPPADPLPPVSHQVAFPPVTPATEPPSATAEEPSVPPAEDPSRFPVTSGPAPEHAGHGPAPVPEATFDEPVSHQPDDEIALPPVSPPAASPVPVPAVTGAPAPPVTPLPVPATEQPPPSSDPKPQSEPSAAAAPDIIQPPAPVPAPSEPELSPRQARRVRRATDREEKGRRKQAEKAAKKARKSNPGMHSRVVGLKVGATQIAAAEVVNKSGPRIVRMARMPLERGVVVGGEVRDPDTLATALKTLFRKNRLSKSHVRLGVSNNRIGVRTFEIVGIEDEKQLANAIRFRAQETLPIPLEDAVLDYRILDERQNEDGIRVRRVLLVVAHRELVERYVSACRKAGLKLVGIDLEAFALLRALSDPANPPAEDAAVVCVTIGHDRSTLAVSDGRVCEFTRVLPWGGSALDAAVARVLDLTPSTAEPIRRALSLDDEGEEAGLDARHADEARRAVAGELQVFAREIIASLRFYQEQPESLGISEIAVTGGAAASGGLAGELTRLIGIPVRVGDPLGRVKLPRKLRNARDVGVGSLAVAVGLGIED